MSIVNDLRSLPLFQGIGDAQLGELVSAFQARTYPTGTVLFRPDDVATHFEILTKGEVTIEGDGEMQRTGVGREHERRTVDDRGQAAQTAA